jgi:hypothetical protein
MEKLLKTQEPDYLEKCKNLYHISLSFSIIMLLNKNMDLFHEHHDLSL